MHATWGASFGAFGSFGDNYNCCRDDQGCSCSKAYRCIAAYTGAWRRITFRSIVLRMISSSMLHTGKKRLNAAQASVELSSRTATARVQIPSPCIMQEPGCGLTGVNLCSCIIAIASLKLLSLKGRGHGPATEKTVRTTSYQQEHVEEEMRNIRVNIPHPFTGLFSCLPT